MGLGDEAWGHYAFFHEPLERKLSKEQKASYTKLAMKCGREEGVLLKTANPQKTVLEITRDMGIRVETPDIPNGGGHVTFAQYEETGKIIIFMDCIKKADDLIRSEGMEELFADVDIFSVLLSHELFHVVEHKKRNTIFTQTEKIELWRKPFSNKSRIIALSEMAAMAFAGEIQGLPFSPYVFDVVLMYCYSKEAAEALYEEIMEAASQKEENDADNEREDRMKKLADFQRRRERLRSTETGFSLKSRSTRRKIRKTAGSRLTGNTTISSMWQRGKNSSDISLFLNWRRTPVMMRHGIWSFIRSRRIRAGFT